MIVSVSWCLIAAATVVVGVLVFGVAALHGPQLSFNPSLVSSSFGILLYLRKSLEIIFQFCNFCLLAWSAHREARHRA